MCRRSVRNRSGLTTNSSSRSTAGPDPGGEPGGSSGRDPLDGSVERPQQRQAADIPDEHLGRRGRSSPDGPAEDPHQVASTDGKYWATEFRTTVSNLPAGTLREVVRRAVE